MDSGYVDDGHGTPTASTLTAVATVARYESILLDPVYTGGAMNRLIGLIVNERQFTKGENVLFLHTGGNVGLFGCKTRIDDFLAYESCDDVRDVDVGAGG